MSKQDVKTFIETPLGKVVIVGLFILVGEFLIMVLIEGVFNPILKNRISTLFWEFFNPIMLTIIVSPALNKWVLRPMRIQQEVLERQLDELRIAAATFEAQEGMVITDANKIILRVNRSFTDLTGYTSEEAVGKTPAMLKSGRQDGEFYRHMWEAIRREKFWQGEIWNRRKNGEIYPEWLTVSAVVGADGNIINYVGIFSDITLRKKTEAEIQRLAFFDALTDLPNRRLALDRLQLALVSSGRHNNHGAIMFIDLDNFKDINDTKGHEAGDELLIEVAHRLLLCVRAEDSVARLGGDEFVVIMGNLSAATRTATAQAEAVGNKILDAIEQPVFLKGQECSISCSIGIRLFHDCHEAAGELLNSADAAMYQAKVSGRNAICFSGD